MSNPLYLVGPNQGYKQVNDAITAVQRDVGRDFENDVEIRIVESGGYKAFKVSLWGDLFIHHQEEHTVNPSSWSFTLDDVIEHATPEVEINGRDVPRGHYEIDGQIIRFKDPKYRDRKVRVTYRYRQTIDLEDQTIGDLKATLEAIQVEGQQLLQIDLQERG